MARRLRWSSVAWVWALGTTLSGCMVDPKALAQAFSALQLKPQGPAPGASAQALRPNQLAPAHGPRKTLTDEAFAQAPPLPAPISFKGAEAALTGTWVLRTPPAHLAGAMVFLPEGHLQPEDLALLAGLAQVEADLREQTLPALLDPTHREIMRVGYLAWLEKQEPWSWTPPEAVVDHGLERVGEGAPRLTSVLAPPRHDGQFVEEDRVGNLGGLVVSKRPGGVLVPLALAGMPLDRPPPKDGAGPLAALVSSLPARLTGAEALQQRGLTAGAVEDPAHAPEQLLGLNLAQYGAGYEEFDLIFSQFGSGTRWYPSTRVERRVRLIDGRYVHRTEGLVDGGRVGYVWRGPKRAADWTAPTSVVEEIGEGFLEGPTQIIRFRILRGPDGHLPQTGKGAAG